MNQTEILEMVRRHCPALAEKIEMHETGEAINELTVLLGEVKQNSHATGYDRGYNDGYDRLARPQI